MLPFWDRLFSNESIHNPDILGQKPKRNLDISRITRAPLIIAIVVAILTGGVMTYTLSLKSNAAQGKEATADQAKNAPLDTIAVLDKQQENGVIGADNTSNSPVVDLSNGKNPPDNSSNTTQTAPATLDTSAINNNASPPPQNPYQAARFQQWQQHQQELQTLEEAKQSTLQNALGANTTVFTNNQTANNPSGTLYGNVKQQQSPDGSMDNTHFNTPGALPDTANYLMHTRVKPVSPYEVKAGTVIPSVMIGGINSDLPGEIIAQVAQNVYDTASGQYLLIPQGTKIVGTYEHRVISGQKRVLVIWNRLIYPDASSINLEGMSGADQSGYSGFKDKTDTHFWPTFRNALMLSAITAGVQLSQPPTQSGNNAYSSQQILAGSLGMQMNQLGMGTLNQNLSQAPTITIRPGYVFNVMVNKDVILPPWQGVYGATS